jgi:dipeptidase E
MTRRRILRFLLTSAGINNTSIHDALVDLLGKPIAESSALCIPTAVYANPNDGAGHAWRFISGRSSSPMVELGWKSVGVLELTALPSVGEAHWVPMVRETDVLLVNGGDPLYLCYWMRHSGLADLLPSLRETVYVGLSAGSMVLTPTFGTAYDDWFCREPPAPANNLPVADDRALGLVDFSVFPHVDHERFPENSMANAEKWAAGRPAPTYAIDDQTAVKVVDDTVEVISEGHWRLFTPKHQET